MLNHEWVQRTTLTKPQLDVLHVDLHTILKRLLVLWTQTGSDLVHRPLKNLHFVHVTVCVRQTLKIDR
jgi:hypothetical protein